MHLMLNIIERLAGKNIALSCSKMMLIDYNKAYQAPYMMLESLLTSSDDVVTAAKVRINENLHSKLNIEELANSFAIGQRTLLRRFKASTGETLLQYIQKSKIELVKRLLETTDLGLNQVVERTGYLDLSSFSLLFKRLTRLTPKEYRQKFKI